MSDCIRKSAVSTMLMDIEWNNGTFTEAILKLNDLPTVDEKEIIRKPFERVVERLEKKAKEYTNDDLTYCIPYFGIEEAIEIVKEECGINE